MDTKRHHVRRLAVLAGAACLSMVLAGCSSGDSGSGSSQTTGVTINVALGSPPPKAALAAFTKSTGITVKWSNVDWDSLQTKISAAATANTYFADATDVDWSRVGQLGQLNWFYPMEKYLDTKAMAADMPQLNTFTSGSHVIGIPYDASFMVTTVNKDMFAKAGITTMPTTIEQYTKDLQQIKTAGISQYPLNIPFAAAEGLSTYWYQTTGAFGGTILNGKDVPQFTDPGSPGYKAAQWMVDALKNGLVPPGNINVNDSQGQQTLMAKGTVATTFSDYSGNVGSLYDVPASSSVVGQVQYLPTPGVNGPAKNLDNPDGIGIPRQAKYPAAAAEFIKWFTSADVQVELTGANGPELAMESYNFPSRLSAVKTLASKGKLSGSDQLIEMFQNNTSPVFPQGAPKWYPQFSNAVYTNLHAAATGSMTVDAAIKAIAGTASKLASGS
ncbi:extracellular solute-binding protein [Rathayibacter soli]|uniref:extracellular solute-binding protein n=1 Tax=Rathayibacter soli TaxID=3144168 RepID=UPI0027E43EB5|nr:extracellular solute-binding protein [Glaciibacter superstes]